MAYETKSLVNVSRVLSPDVHALPHVVETVNDFLMPATIDGAVFNDLKRVVKTHGDSRAWTAAAMDGAAARGRLDIMQWLHDNRSEGCSTEACMAAAANGSLKVVKWLHELYPEVCRPVEAMTAAAENDHAGVVRFFRTSVNMEDAVPALENAAVHGRVDVVDALVPYFSGLAQGAFMVASAHGQLEVVRLLLGHGFTSVVYTNPSLKEAAAGGHVELVDLLLELCDDDALADAVDAAVRANRTDILQVIVERRHPRDIGVALEQAALDNRYEMVRLLLDNCPEEKEVYLSRSSVLTAGDSDRTSRWDTLRSIDAATTAVTMRGHVETARLLATKCSDSAAGMALKIAVETSHLEMAKLFIAKSNPVGKVDALVAAVLNGQTDMVAALLEHGDPRMIEQALVKVSSAGNRAIAQQLLEKCDPASRKRVFENAAANGVVGLVHDMLDQVDELTAGDALRLAAMNGHTEAVKLLLVKSDAAGVVSAFNVAAMQGRLAVVELLSERD
ncbi:unnamed protein product [Phytophthora fragariaefolia]|uniref:Unnamed protein product n=1 Tax=Phytophthora fragariaefolia TaxID=1490495 RepID=A0A9W6XKX2_9STRA|nr:unnamed protein product [Phytophthora fragariaefolia]